VLLVLWYGGGHLYNRRRGRRLFRWLEAGLDVLGGEKQAGWLGSPATGARVNVTHAASPFRRLELTLLLENRENLPLWLLGRLRGKRDWLIIKATLRSPRHGEIEVGSAGLRIVRDLEQSWTRQEGLHGLVMVYQGSGAAQQVTQLSPWLETYGGYLQRFSWRKADPHIQLQVRVGGLLATSSEAFLTCLQAAIGESNAR
jgi:hypothetical protein